ncbi:DUF3592 domain-containing protein [Rhizobium sp. ZPR3]|uniref:DUF3592 domain-containing protein n=2 Tax=unclassified Rhizobium TaxID=2613769 RepID=A0AAU7SQY1_9HYPH
MTAVTALLDCRFVWRAVTAGMNREKTVGVVIALDRHVEIAPLRKASVMNRGSDTVTTYAPIVVFQGDDGMSYRVQGGVYSSYNPARIGDQIPVYYRHDDPHDAIIASFQEIWLPVIVGSGMAAAFALALFGTIWLTREKPADGEAVSRP